MNTQYHIAQLFKHHFREDLTQLTPLAKSGSNRSYYRVQSRHHTAIATHHTDPRENHAFVALSRHFANYQLNVPQLYADDLPNGIYLQQDLGNETLLHCIQRIRQANDNDSESDRLIHQLYRQVIDALLRLQIEGDKQLEYDIICAGRTRFDRQALLWDMQYFKYCFLKLYGSSYDEQGLEHDFNCLADYLMQADTSFFMLRDCQARNIMWHQEQPYFIDYQGGMRGALQYDLASLLFQARANLSPANRTQLLDYYVQRLQTILPIQPDAFKQQFYGYVLARNLQVLGAYGLRGLHEHKPLFLQSIPLALSNLQWLLESGHLPIELPELTQIAQTATALPHHNEMVVKNTIKSSDNAYKNIVSAVSTEMNSPLSVRVNSFSYHVALPTDPTEHGIGFVFDCRSIHNPGRYEPYKHLTGKDAPVMRFLETETHIATYLAHVFALIDHAVLDYTTRGLAHLTVNFGCTGGQHRSVYCAEATTQHLHQRYGIVAILNHCNESNWQRLA